MSMTIDEKIEVLQAYKEGKKIEFKPINFNDWIDCGWEHPHLIFTILITESRLDKRRK